MNIKFLKNKDIDCEKWDFCVENSTHPLVYGMSWYLDAATENYDALVLDDYSAVMPLPRKRKFGLRYIYQPAYIQQLGIFGQVQSEELPINSFFQKIPRSFIKVTTNLNNGHNYKTGTLKPRTNYVLDLSENYDVLRKSFSENTKRNLKKLQNIEQILVENADPDELINLKIKQQPDIFTQYNQFYLKRIIDVLQEKKYGFCISTKDRNGEISAAVYFIHFKKRLYYLSGISNDKGLKMKSMFLIFDHIIKNYSGSDTILDFEGSDIDGIARFFAGWGAKPTIYYTLSKKSLINFP